VIAPTDRALAATAWRARGASRRLRWRRAARGALELTWDDLSARVAVIASDRNVRNKARFAGLSALRTDDV
jgi:hypothetical protein